MHVSLYGANITLVTLQNQQFVNHSETAVPVSGRTGCTKARSATTSVYMVVVLQNQQFLNHQKTQVRRPAQNTPLFNGEKNTLPLNSNRRTEDGTACAKKPDRSHNNNITTKLNCWNEMAISQADPILIGLERRKAIAPRGIF